MLKYVGINGVAHWMSYKIFIIEDNSLNLKLFTDLLTIRNYGVVSSSDGSDLTNRVLYELPDLILMDIHLKGRSGIDLIYELKNNDKVKNIPIIAVTALTLSKDIASIMEAGCAKYLPKPVAMVDFYSAIEEFLPQKD